MKLIAATASAIVVGTVIFFAFTRSGTGKDLVKIELRAKPVASIKFKGKRLGDTPITIQVPRGSEALEIEATFTLHKLNAMTGAAKVELRRQTKTVVPDDHQSVDFDIKGATKVPDLEK